MEAPVIISLPQTNVSAILKTLQKTREEGGAVALGRVMTLVIATSEGKTERVIDAANEASREHPMRIIVITEISEKETELDAEIRLGGDAGASEVIILNVGTTLAKDPQGLINGLLLPDAPMVAWWPDNAPTMMAETPLGKIAEHRIADTINGTSPVALLRTLADSYTPGDVDLGWTRITQWRALLAATLDSNLYKSVNSARVVGASDNSAPILLAAWLRSELGVKVEIDFHPKSKLGNILLAEMVCDTGSIVLERTEPGFAKLSQPGQPVHNISLPLRGLGDCLAEELRRLDEDVVFGRVLKDGLSRLIEEKVVL
jgi:glucose-6-phosphate dehydrogenase assembly protein OpcA